MLFWILLKEKAFLQSDLIDTISHGLQRELSGSVHRLAVVGGPPAGAVDVDELGHVADGRGLYDVSHEGLIQHPDAWKSDTQTQADRFQTMESWWDMWPQSLILIWILPCSDWDTQALISQPYIQ